VILIIFMVSAPVFIKSSINVTLPKAASGKAGEPTTMNITISLDGKIDLNGETVTKESIGSKVRVMVQKQPEISAVISADRKVEHGTVIEVVDSLQLNGVRKFAINVESP
jgi:biopolymer transport protein ExbD